VHEIRNVTKPVERLLGKPAIYDRELSRIFVRFAKKVEPELSLYQENDGWIYSPQRAANRRTPIERKVKNEICNVGKQRSREVLACSGCGGNNEGESRMVFFYPFDQGPSGISLADRHTVYPYNRFAVGIVLWNKAQPLGEPIRVFSTKYGVEKEPREKKDEAYR
jgi:hypothetical protein